MGEDGITIEGERVERVIVDTYALMAAVFGELPPRARQVLIGIREGRVEGLVPPTVPYEFAVHWLRGRIPGLTSLAEVMAFFSAYFSVIDFSLEDYVASAELKVKGDEMLSSSGDSRMSGRRLSLVDASVIRAALRERAPVVTGDADLSHVAAKLGIAVIW
ncbi:MAG: PIN domain nuclease [Thermoproteota archaeon]|nr:MAG: PIN domain nuclease [Candidatus Korarchaeota archaeon]